MLAMRLSEKLFVVFWLFLPLISVAAQYRFDSWTADNGLPQNSVYSIVQTPDGYLWMATLDGLVRFDGVKFTVFNKSNSKNLTTNRFINLFAEADGTLWLGAEESGLVRFKDGQFQIFTIADGLPSNQVQQVQKDLDGSLLIFTSKGLARWRDGRFSVERQGDFRDYKIYVAPSGIRWEMDKDGLRSVAKDGSEARYDVPFAASDISSDRTFNYFYFVPMLEDAEGALWFAAAGALFKLKNGATGVFNANNGMPASLVRSLVQDRAGAIWLGTEKDGVCRFGEGNRAACFGTGKGLYSDNVRSLLVDREGTLWAGTNERGINRISPRVVESVSTAEGLAGKNVYPILEDDAGGVWIGSFTGLAYYKNGKITNYARRDGLLYEVVQSLFLDRDGRLWIGSVGGIEVMENGKFTDYTEKLGLSVGEVEFWDIHQDRAGVMWLATKKGLIKYTDGAAEILTTADGLPTDDVRIIHEARDGSLWIGCFGGLAHLKDGKITHLTQTEGLAGNHVRAIYEDAENALWIGTYDDGLLRLKDGKLTNYTVKDGLYSNGVFQILPDERGNFWMSGNQGIYRVSRRELNDFADGKLARITSAGIGKSDGMLNTECNGGRQPAGIKTRDGKFWFPTQDGAAIIDPEKIGFNPLPPPVVIESAMLDNAPPSTVNSLTIQPDQGNLEIHYTGLSFIKPEQMRFRYRLEGLDENWTDAGARREARYPYLPPGNYTFRVIAANSDNVWNETGAAIRIEVLPPYYRQSWFVVLSLLFAVGIVFVLYKRRIWQLERERAAEQAFSRQLISSQEQERKRIAAELHDSLGQRLVVIKNLAVMFLNAKNGDKAEFQQVEAISAEASEAIGEVKEISYNLRPYQLDRIGLTKAIEAIIRSARAASAIEFSTKIDNIDDYFPRDSEINFYRIVQECVNNAVKHSAAKNAFVKIGRSETWIDFEISDDGCGFAAFQTESKAGGFGLLGITERAALFGGKVEIKSAPNQGTIVRMRLKREEV